MALNLSTLTSPTTSGDVLAEMLTTADFLDPVPVLRNIARGPNKGGDAKQTTALNQPKALPLIKNPSGKLGGYLYIPNVSGNYATGPSVTIGANETWEGELDMVVTQWGNYIMPMGGGAWSSGFGLIFYADQKVQVFSKGDNAVRTASNVTLGTPFNVKYGFDGVDIYVDIDGTRVYTSTAPSQSISGTSTLELNQQSLTEIGNYAIQKAKLTVNSSVVFDCDFNGSTSIRHGDTKFQCATGQTVTINQAGNDPATVIKKSVLRFDGADDSLGGLFNQTIDSGYMFAAFSVLGDGGHTSGRVFAVNSTGQLGSHISGSGAIFSIHQETSNDLRSYINNGYRANHPTLFDDANGDILHESLIKNGSQLSRVNNADERTTSVATSLSAEEFSVAARSNLSYNAAIDLYWLGLFPATISDAEAARVVSWVNRRSIFDLKDGFGHYFYDGTKAPVGAISSGSSSWNGRIVGSDNGDADKYATQATSSDQPVSDGYKVTFADNTDHLDIPSTAQAGWQVVGTSLGTFAYKINNNSQTELSLLGNLGSTSYRQAGDLYGIILLPETANGKEIEAARQVLINRGAADGTTAASLYTYWYDRDDIVEFKHINTSSVTSVISPWAFSSALEKFPALDLSNSTSFESAWKNCNALTSFPAGAKLGTAAENVIFASAWRSSGLTSFPANIDLSKGTSFNNAWRQSSLNSFPAIESTQNGTSFSDAWYNCTSLVTFGNANLSSGTSFTSAWQGCSALTSFSAGAKLGTAAENVDFTSAWQSSGLTSFPADIDLSKGTTFTNTWRSTNLNSFSTPLPSGTSFYAAWRDCTNLSSFSSEINGSNVRFGWYGCSSLTSFSTPLSNVNRFDYSWRNCTSLTDFSADVFANWNPYNLVSGIFDQAWVGTALSAASVENILVGISNSGKYATTNGASGGSALGNAGIDIGYNVATGALSAATNTAIRSLSGKGWQVVINGEIRTGVGLLDTSGYYFFESEGLPVASVATWDSSVSSSSASLDLVGAQTTGPDQPVADGTLVTFADNTDFLTIPSTTQAGWQIVGTSLGTFAYEINNNSQTELNLLGNLGYTTLRKSGDLYGIILLPQTATGADIEEARQLLIDRGAADGTTSSQVSAYFFNRTDIISFVPVNISSAINISYSWYQNTALTSFPIIDISNVLNVSNAWQSCTALTSFPALDMSSGTNFTSAWHTCSSLTTIGSGVLLGTSKSNVNFTTSFYGCTNLTGLPAGLNLSKGDRFNSTFYNCSSLVDFPAGAFDTLGTPASSCFFWTWLGCSALSATSVENILSSIDTSGQSGPASGPQITIDYDGTALSAATNTAVTSLKSKGWAIVVNGTTL